MVRLAMYFFTLGFFFTGFVVACTEGQVIKWGKCPEILVKQNFTISPYAGTWYEQQRYFAVFELGLQCVSATYTLLSDGSIKVNNTGQKSNNSTVSVVGAGYAPNPDVPAKLLIKFPGKGPAGDYWVIGTDYLSFSVVWACRNFGPLHLINSWLLSRQRSGFSHDAMEKIERILRKHNIDKDPYLPTVQVGCIE